MEKPGRWLWATPSGASSKSWPLPYRLPANCSIPSSRTKPGSQETPCANKSLQAILASNPCQGKWAVLQIDVRNAFNTVNRSAIMDAVGTHAGHLLQASLQPSALYLGETTIRSSEGGQQGAPLSPLYFFWRFMRPSGVAPRH
jgi:hypothetical protein